MRRRVYRPHKPMKAGMFEVTVYLDSTREYMWKGRAGSDDIAMKLAMKRLTKQPPVVGLTRVRD